MNHSFAEQEERNGRTHRDQVQNLGIVGKDRPFLFADTDTQSQQFQKDSNKIDCDCHTCSAL